MWRRAWRTMRAGVCHSVQRSVLGSATARAPVKQSSWNQRTRASAKQDHRQPGPVGVDGDEREPVGARVLQAADVIFDVGVSTHVDVQIDGVTGGVGVVTPVAVVQ